MKAKPGVLLISILVLTACTSTTTTPIVPSWQKSLSAARYYDLGIRHLRKGKYQQAIPLLRKALEIDPDFMAAREQLAVAHHHLGNEFLEWKRYALASNQFKIALTLDPHLDIARRGLKAATQGLKDSAPELE